jgi:hypothetical protein
MLMRHDPILFTNKTTFPLSLGACRKSAFGAKRQRLERDEATVEKARKRSVFATVSTFSTGNKVAANSLVLQPK